MRAIIIGAGRGMRLGHHTQEIPKTMVEVLGRPMLDWIIEALGSAGIRANDIVFIGGYAEEVVRRAHPEFSFVSNSNWEHNNILFSLMCARDLLEDGFVSTYGDIVYDGQIVKKLVSSDHDITLGCDTHWRRRYVNRSRHPESDAEKLRAKGSKVLEISRTIASEQASGEFIGVMKVSRAGARSLLAHFDAAEQHYKGRPFREGRSWEKAYLIDLLQHMLEGGVPMHRVDTPGAYMEIDTVEDLGFAEAWWRSRPQ
jgi:L-glutamine-phosphate cytidylyltransferase